MLIINILLDEIPSSFTGQVILYLNTGGVRKATIEEERFLKVIKADSIKPQQETLISPQRST
jgi:hypothetical protein